MQTHSATGSENVDDDAARVHSDVRNNNVPQVEPLTEQMKVWLTSGENGSPVILLKDRAENSGSFLEETLALFTSNMLTLASNLKVHLSVI